MIKILEPRMVSPGKEYPARNKQITPVQKKSPTFESIYASTRNNQNYLQYLQGITFKGETQPKNPLNRYDTERLLDETIKELCGEPLFNRLHISSNASHDFSDELGYFVFNAKHFIFYVNYEKLSQDINAGVVDQQKAMKQVATGIKNIFEFQLEYYNKINPIVDSINAKLGINEHHGKPDILYFYSPSSLHGQSSSTNRYDVSNNVYINAYWLTQARHKDLYSSIILGHEISHHKTKLLLSMLNREHFSLEDREKYDGSFRFFEAIRYRYPAFKTWLEGTDYQKAIESFFMEEMDTNEGNRQLSNSDSIDKFEEFKERIVQLTGISPLELKTVNFKKLANGHIELKTPDYVNIAITGKQNEAKIKAKLVEHQNQILTLAEEFNLKDLLADLISVYEVYKNSPDEVLARHNELRITQSNIEDGTIIVDEPELRELILNTTLEKPKNEKFREVHSASLLPDGWARQQRLI